MLLHPPWWLVKLHLEFFPHLTLLIDLLCTSSAAEAWFYSCICVCKDSQRFVRQHRMGLATLKLLSYQYSKPELTDREAEEAWQVMSGQQINVWMGKWAQRKEACTARQADTSQIMELPEPLPHYISPHQNTITRKHIHVHMLTWSHTQHIQQKCHMHSWGSCWAL